MILLDLRIFQITYVTRIQVSVHLPDCDGSTNFTKVDTYWSKKIKDFIVYDKPI